MPSAPGFTPPRRPEVPIGIDPGSELTGGPADDLQHSFRQQNSSNWTIRRDKRDPRGYYTLANGSRIYGSMPASPQQWKAVGGGVLPANGSPVFYPNTPTPNADGRRWTVGLVKNGHPYYYSVFSPLPTYAKSLETPSVREDLGKVLKQMSGK